MIKTRVCKICHKRKLISAFYKHTNTAKYLYIRTDCRECVKEKHKIWRKNNPNNVKLSHIKQNLKRKYGLSLEIYFSLCKAQKYRCCICKQKRKLCVDHSHKTGKIRGLLCRNCNAAIGMLKEDLNILKTVITYLKIHKS